MILKAAQSTKGACGPSSLDADQYRHILASRKYKQEGKDLREQMALLAKKLATSIIDPATLEAYTACRLIPLDKAPGVRPIGVGEVLRRIIGKVIGATLKDDIQEAAGPLQVSTGLKGGSEAAIHAMREIFELDACDGAILVDASNAFNRLNRRVALHNIQYICPEFATILINTYRQPARLFVTGGKEIASCEGTTQGDNLAMAFYGLSTAPLQQALKDAVSEVKQVWLADDATGAGRLAFLRHWWAVVIEVGRKYGYYVNESKSWLILKDPNLLEEAMRLFDGTGIKFTTAGKRHLGASLGSLDFRDEYVGNKIAEWRKEVEKLAEFAKSQPHAAYAAYVHGEQHRFRFFMRTIPGMERYLKPLDDIIDQHLIPAIVGTNVSETERELFALPVRDGGLGFPQLCEIAQSEFIASRTITAPLAAIIVLQGVSLPDEDEVKHIRHQLQQEKSTNARLRSEAVDTKLSPATMRAVEQAREKGASSWLTARPSLEHGFVLNKSEFRDAIAIRYSQPIKNLPSQCPCGQQFTMTHAMNCKRGGFINIRHNEIRDFEASLLSKVCTDVEVEPPLTPLQNELLNNGAIKGDDARLDVRARGFWRRGQNAYFDVCVTNASAKSYADQSIKSLLQTHEKGKKRDYNQRVMEIEHGTLTPLVFTVNGCMGPECVKFHKNLADRIAEKTGEDYADVIKFMRCKLSYILIRSALLCIRGSRRRTSRDLVEVGDDFGLYNSQIGLNNDI